MPRRPPTPSCSAARPLHAEPGHVRFEFRATEQFLNPAGVVQGGFLTAMLDETMGPAALSELGPGFMRADARAEGQLPAGRPARAGWSPTRASCTWARSVVFLEASLVDEDGEADREGDGDRAHRRAEEAGE